jgi:adenylosuccinate synthase
MKRKRIALIGAQTGDEGKGVREVHYVQKAVENSPDPTSESMPVWTLRWQGGANAGHTVGWNGTAYKLHQIPSGILIPKTYNFMGEGVFFNPREGMQEIINLQSQGVEITPRNFGIASNAHVTLEYHTEDGRRDFEKEKHTGTGRGIKETAVDKQGRVGIRFQEFLDRETFIQILKEKRFPKGFPEQFGAVEEFADSYAEEREFLAQFSALQADALERHGTHFGIGEGAQGFKLDVDRGYYPGVTSSNPSIVPFRADVILGVVKMYESSVGSDRPFVGQMNPDLEARVRDLWGERGTTTGKPRDLGWLDVVALRHAIRSCEIDHLVGTCGDRMEAMAEANEPVKLVVAYEIDGNKYTDWDNSFHNRTTLYRARPIFEELKPWRRFVDDNGELSPNARTYVDRIQELTGTEFALHGFGPGVDDVIEAKDVVGSAA